MKTRYLSHKSLVTIGGFTLIELMIVIVITTIGMMFAADQVVRSHQDVQAKLAADNMTIIGIAMDRYAKNNATALGAQLGVSPFYKDITQADLVSDGSLSQTFAPANPWGSAYKMRFWRVGTGPYTIQGLVMTASPWKVSSVNRIDLARSAALKMGCSGGWTIAQATTSGPIGCPGLNSFGWSSPASTYPLTGMVPASYDAAGGQLFYQINSGASINDATYLRIDGTNKMLAALNMNNNGILAATNVTATNIDTATVNATGLITANAVSAAGLISGATVNATGVITGGVLTSNGNINIAPGAILQSTGRMHIQSGETLYLQPFSNASGSKTSVGGGGGSGDLAVLNNITATNDVLISNLASRSNSPITTSVKALLPTLVEVGSVPLNIHGQNIPLPTCDAGGIPKIFPIPQTVTGLVDGGRWGADIHVTGADNGVPPWTFYAKDAAGNILPSQGPLGYIALARIFCSY